MGRRLVATLIVVSVGAATAVAGSNPPPGAVRANLARLGLQAVQGDRSFLVSASSMEPTLHCNRPRPRCGSTTADRVLVRPYGPGHTPQRGEIVVFQTPPAARKACGAGGLYIKRVIALPRETWQERHGSVLIGGHRLAEPYVRAGRRDGASFRARRVLAGRYFVMGDNRRFSCDSRLWGAVNASAIVGRALAVYWPTTRVRRL